MQLGKDIRINGVLFKVVMLDENIVHEGEEYLSLVDLDENQIMVSGRVSRPLNEAVQAAESHDTGVIGIPMEPAIPALSGRTLIKHNGQYRVEQR